MSTTFSKTSEHEAPYLVAIVGPTAVGKSRVALELARRFDSAVINADSRQFYREMRIGTARPGPEETKAVPHYFLGDRSIEEERSAGDFEKEALELLPTLFRDKRILFLVGGSGLYVDALLEGLDHGLPDPDPELRASLNRISEKEGLSPLLEELKKKDPEHYEKMDRQNPRRVIRALEVIRSSGRPYSEFRKKEPSPRPFRELRIGLWRERSALHRRIEDRVERMMEEGLLEEVRRLLPYRDRNALRTVGYQELFPYFDGETELDTAKELIKRNTRRYAKRQMTWFRKHANTRWSHPDEHERIARYIEEQSGIRARSDEAPSDT